MTGRFRTRLHRGERIVWEQIRSRVAVLEREEWGQAAFSEPELARQFLASNAVNVLLYDGTRLVGFACSAPSRGGARTTYLWNILIARRYRGRGLVSKLMNTLEPQLRRQGYRFLGMDARVDNGFADAVARHYGPRVTVAGSDHPSDYGIQRPLRIALLRPASRAARGVREEGRKRATA